MTANRAELAQLFEAERPGRLAAEYTNNVFGALSALPLGELTGRRRRSVVVAVNDQGAIADGPSVLLPANAHVGFGEQPALFFRHGQTFDQRRRRVADSANNRCAFDELAPLQAYALECSQRDSGVQDDLD